MAEPFADLIADIETEQRTLIEKVLANLEAEVEEGIDPIIESQRAMEPVMRRMGEATQRLVAACAEGPAPAGLAERVEQWRAELSKLLAAVQDRTTDLADRRALISQTLQRLNRATVGLDGYRKPRPGGARFIQREA